MDLARWWNTKGQLGSLGEAALRRGFPRTHHFAQARSVFAVASARCSELFSSSGSVSLFQLPEGVEEEFDAKWEGWLDTANAWGPFFQSVAAIASHDLPAILQSLGLASANDVAGLVQLKRYLKPRAFACTCRVFIHADQRGDDPGDLCGVRDVGPRALQAGEPRPSPRGEFARGPKRDLAAGHRVGPQPTLRY